MRGLRLSLFVVTLALAAAVVWMLRGAIEPVQHDRYSGALRKLQALDARLGHDLLRVRTGGLRQFDPLVRELAEMKRLAHENARAPDFVTPSVRADLDREMKAFGDALGDKERKIDEFKTEWAVLRNSLYYFPVLAADVEQRSSGGAQLAVQELERDVLAYSLLRERTLAARIDATVLRLALDPHGDSDTGILLQHARIIRERTPRVESLLAAIFAVPTSAQADRLYVTYIAEHRRQLARSSLQHSVVYLLVMAALALLAAIIILSLRRGAQALAAEREKSDRLLLNVLPVAIADRLKRQSEPIADAFTEVTVLFGDIVGFTEMASRVTAIELVDMLNNIFSAFDRLAAQHGLEKIKTIGDAYMVVAGLPEARADHAEAMAEMALDMQAEIARIAAAHGHPFQIRIGLHSGPVVAGVIGLKKFAYDLWGDTVNIASRMESHGMPGRIQISDATAERLHDRFVLSERGVIKVKGRGEMKAWFLDGRKAEAKTA